MSSAEKAQSLNYVVDKSAESLNYVVGGGAKSLNYVVGCSSANLQQRQLPYIGYPFSSERFVRPFLEDAPDGGVRIRLADWVGCLDFTGEGVAGRHEHPLACLPVLR